jgi:hypothetical protein
MSSLMPIVDAAILLAISVVGAWETIAAIQDRNMSLLMVDLFDFSDCTELDRARQIMLDRHGMTFSRHEMLQLAELTAAL